MPRPGNATPDHPTTTAGTRPGRSNAVAALVAGLGLTLLALSPFFNWVNIAGGGIIGLRGDGSIVLGVTGVALVAFLAVLFQRKGQTLVVLGVQAWATLAVFWMATHIWKVGSLVH